MSGGEKEPWATKPAMPPVDATDAHDLEALKPMQVVHVRNDLEQQRIAQAAPSHLSVWFVVESKTPTPVNIRAIGPAAESPAT